MNLNPLRIALMSAAAALALPAAAETTVMPGTFCVPDGVVESSVTGLMVNKVTATGTTAFHCPFIRNQPAGFAPGSVTITVNARTNSSASFKCQMRSVTATNGTFDLYDVVFTASGTNGGYDSRTVTLLLPPDSPGTTPASVHMRCAVPNVTNTTAGIVSYSITQ